MSFIEIYFANQPKLIWPSFQSFLALKWPQANYSVGVVSTDIYPIRARKIVKSTIVNNLQKLIIAISINITCHRHHHNITATIALAITITGGRVRLFFRLHHIIIIIM